MHRPVLLSRAHIEAPPEDDTGPPFLPWASTEPVLVVIDKESRSLSVYEHGRRTGHFPAVFGRVDGRKLYEGDKRTPSGVYRITKKRPHWRFHRFFDLDYPNREDLRNFREARAAGIVPVSLSNGIRPGTGGLIGIHGSDDEKLNRADLDWTLGCVSLLNEHMDELDGLVHTGTPVLIRDDEPPARLRSLLPVPETPPEPTLIEAMRDDRPGDSPATGAVASVVEDAAASGPGPDPADTTPETDALASAADDGTAADGREDSDGEDAVGGVAALVIEDAGGAPVDETVSATGDAPVDDARTASAGDDRPAGETTASADGARPVSGVAGDDGAKTAEAPSAEDSHVIREARREQSGIFGLIFGR